MGVRIVPLGSETSPPSPVKTHHIANVPISCGRPRGKWPASPATPQAGHLHQWRVGYWSGSGRIHPEKGRETGPAPLRSAPPQPQRGASSETVPLGTAQDVRGASRKKTLPRKAPARGSVEEERGRKRHQIGPACARGGLHRTPQKQLCEGCQPKRGGVAQNDGEKMPPFAHRSCSRDVPGEGPKPPECPPRRPMGSCSGLSRSKCPIRPRRPFWWSCEGVNLRGTAREAVSMCLWRCENIGVRVVPSGSETSLPSPVKTHHIANVPISCGRPRGKWPASPATQQAGRQLHWLVGYWSESGRIHQEKGRETGPAPQRSAAPQPQRGASSETVPLGTAQYVRGASRKKTLPRKAPARGSVEEERGRTRHQVRPACAR